jgi:hypothetical protein
METGLLAVALARRGNRDQSGPNRTISGPDGELLLLS